MPSTPLPEISTVLIQRAKLLLTRLAEGHTLVFDKGRYRMDVDGEVGRVLVTRGIGGVPNEYVGLVEPMTVGQLLHYASAMNDDEVRTLAGGVPLLGEKKPRKPYTRRKPKTVATQAVA